MGGADLLSISMVAERNNKTKWKTTRRNPMNEIIHFPAPILKKSHIGLNMSHSKNNVLVGFHTGTLLNNQIA